MPPDLKRVNTLAVRLGERRIGLINRLAGDRHIFAFEQDYLDDPDRPTLSLSFKGRSGGLVNRLKPYRRRVPPFFSNLLPEGPLRRYLAQQSGVSEEREFHLLAALGADLSGAVIVEPAGPDASAEDDAHAADTQQEQERDHAPAGALRFSLAGVQLKFSAVAEASGGLTIPARGVGGSWIVKLPSTQFPAVAENELVMLSLARHVGIETPPARIVSLSAIRGLPSEAKQLRGKALAVERFDRTADGGRIHMEDFAQVFGLFPEDKYKGRSYANVATVLWAESGPESVYELVRRLAFSIITGNGDMHLKNWSLIYRDGRTPALSPAYDLVSTLPYLPNDQLALTFGGSRGLDEITNDQVRRFADTARLPMNPLWKIVRETLERTAEAWNTLEEKDLLPRDMRRVIGEQINRTAV